MNASTRHSLVAAAVLASQATVTKSASATPAEKEVLAGVLDPAVSGQSKRASLAQLIAAGDLAEEMQEPA